MLQLLFQHETEVTIAMIVVFSLFIAFIIVFLLVSSFLKRKYDKRLDSKCRKRYVFIVYFAENEIVYFRRNNPRVQVRMKLENFYEHILDVRERDLFRSWIESILLENTNLLSEITINFDGRYVVPLYFTVDSVQPDKKIVHLSSYSVEYLDESVKARKYYLAPVNESRGMHIDALYSKKTIPNGVLFFIRFFPLDKRVDDSKETIMINELRQVCFLYLKEKRSRKRIEFDDPHSFVLCDTGSYSLTDMQQMAISLVKRLNSRLEINSYHEIYNFSIGAVEMRFFADGRKCLEVARNKSISAERKENGIDWYTPGETVENFDARIWEQEIDLVLKGRKRDRRLRFLYQPLVSSASLKLYGYVCSCEPENSAFHNFDEMQAKANEYGKNRELLTVTLRSLINKFYNEVVKVALDSGHRNELRLFLPISRYDKEIINKVLSEIRHTRDCHLVLIVEEEEMNETVAKNYEEAIATISAMKKKSCEIALLLHDSNLPWPNSVYEVFDYFIVDRSLTAGEESLMSSSSIKRLAVKLIGFRKPMIALDMDSRSKIQIMRDKRFTIFGGNAIEAASESIIELTPKKINVVK